MLANPDLWFGGCAPQVWTLPVRLITCFQATGESNLPATVSARLRRGSKVSSGPPNGSSSMPKALVTMMGIVEDICTRQ
jgi:hypothetical protein